MWSNLNKSISNIDNSDGIQKQSCNSDSLQFLPVDLERPHLDLVITWLFTGIKAQAQSSELCVQAMDSFNRSSEHKEK